MANGLSKSSSEILVFIITKSTYPHCGKQVSMLQFEKPIDYTFFIIPPSRNCAQPIPPPHLHLKRGHPRAAPSLFRVKEAKMLKYEESRLLAFGM
ncbi:hypothetical protein NC651_012311 [Populus alba x Populus x berolinensis]|nr:hypothetical protein NC651_012311 [Populus alba x Populus x berolinensis]